MESCAHLVYKLAPLNRGKTLSVVHLCADIQKTVPVLASVQDLVTMQPACGALKTGQVYNGVRTTGAVPLHSLIEAAQTTGSVSKRDAQLPTNANAHLYGRCAPSLFTPTTRYVPYARPWRKAFIWP